MMKNFLQRLWTSFIILGMFIFLFAISDFSPFFEISVAILICLCLYEALTCTGCATQKKLLIPCLIYGAAVPLSFIAKDWLFPGRSPYYGVIIASFIFLLTLFVILMANFEATKFSEATIAMFVTFVITCFLTNIIFIRRIENHGFFYMVLCIVCSAWCTDIFAYLVGILIGKHRPFPNISPKKSIEGCIGGALCSIVVYFIACRIYQGIAGVEFNWLLVLLYSLCCTVISQIGDLSFSYIKRSYGIKDFGKVLPGHGGFLDRLDSLIFIAPMFYALINTESFIG
ncbi:MAG: phosphatidate cytidylyltransferase [Clostridia bacterium]|nr:phosphatidate cytidylyltransferase [Clostridia bacterium]